QGVLPGLQAFGRAAQAQGAQIGAGTAQFVQPGGGAAVGRQARVADEKQVRRRRAQERADAGAVFPAVAAAEIHHVVRQLGRRPVQAVPQLVGQHRGPSAGSRHRGGGTDCAVDRRRGAVDAQVGVRGQQPLAQIQPARQAGVHGQSGQAPAQVQDAGGQCQQPRQQAPDEHASDQPQGPFGLDTGGQRLRAQAGGDQGIAGRLEAQQAGHAAQYPGHADEHIRRQQGGFPMERIVARAQQQEQRGQGPQESRRPGSVADQADRGLPGPRTAEQGQECLGREGGIRPPDQAPGQPEPQARQGGRIGQSRQPAGQPDQEGERMQPQQSQQRQCQVDLALAQDGGGRADARQAGAQPEYRQRPAGADGPLDQAVVQLAVFGQPGCPRQDADPQVGGRAQGGLAGGAVFQWPP